MNARTKKLTVMAMLVALSVVLVYLIHIPFPLAPFLEYDPADIPILIGAFAFGPLAGILLTVVASIIQGITVSAQSGIYGIIMHLIATSTLVLVSSSIYRAKHTRRGAVIGLICGTLAMTAVMLVANHFITPYFMVAPPATIQDVTRAVDQMLLPIMLPFNLMKAGINSVITFAVYKVVSRYIVHSEPVTARKMPAEEQI